MCRLYFLGPDDETDAPVTFRNYKNSPPFFGIQIVPKYLKYESIAILFAILQNLGNFSVPWDSLDFYGLPWTIF